MFRGRESAHPELGAKILERIVEKLEHIAKVESAPKLDGRNMLMVLGPDKKPKKKVDANATAEVKEVAAPVATAAPVLDIEAVRALAVTPKEEA